MTSQYQRSIDAINAEFRAMRTPEEIAAAEEAWRRYDDQLKTDENEFRRVMDLLDQQFMEGPRR